MAYTKTTDFTSKDSLLAGDPAKVVKGSEIDTEFDNIENVIGTTTGSGAVVLATSPTLVAPALGTPSSGTVTNLTGTASININGTVGATTPAAGKFTTLVTTNKGGGTFRSDTGLEVQYSTDAGISILHGPNPGSTTYEAFIAFGGYDSAGNTRKMASFSSKWVSADTSTGSGNFRLNATYNGGASDYMVLKGYGNGGARFFSDSTSAPGTDILDINGSVVVRGTTTLGDATSDTVVLNGYFSGTTAFGTSAWPTTVLGKSGQRSLHGGEGILALWNETAGVGAYASLYLGAIHNSVATGAGFAVIKGGTEGTDYASFAKIGTMNGAGSVVDKLHIDSTGNVMAISTTGGIGYGAGAGATVTQGTSRTTGVTINRPTGAITLVSAAGSTSWQSFTMTNSTIAATDTVLVSQKSGTDLYQIHVTAVAAGSCRITYATTGGTTTEQPVFNFAVIKGVTS